MLSNFDFLIYEYHRFVNVPEDLAIVALKSYAGGIRTHKSSQHSR